MGTGILLCNLGTPDAPTPSAVRRFLAEFLWDPRVVEIPRPLWWLILHGFVLRFRPGEVAHAYRQIWTDEGSPLRAIAERQARALQLAFDRSHPDLVKVRLAMRYGTPSIASGLRAFADEGIRQVCVLPAYPQYSCSTTASVFDAVAAELKQPRVVPSLEFIASYHDHPAYIAALAASVRDFWAANGRGGRLLMSFHGVPESYIAAGDPYQQECIATGRLLAAELGLDDDAWRLAFQSRFGRAEWLKPYTDVTLREWAQGGLRKVDVICPGFSADCLETLEEIAIRNRDTFIDAGGEALRYIPALNDRPDHIALLQTLGSSRIMSTRRLDIIRLDPRC